MARLTRRERLADALEALDEIASAEGPIDWTAVRLIVRDIDAFARLAELRGRGQPAGRSSGPRRGRRDVGAGR